MGNQLISINNSVSGNFVSLDNSLNDHFVAYQSWSDSQFNTINQSLVQNNTDLQTSLNNGNGDIKSFLDSMQADINKNLQSVFGYVSDGKRSLASALLTKGVTVTEDAKFNEIKDAILRIPQKLVIGIEELPGDIEYEYHYHTDAAGNCPHTTTSSQLAGCYTIAVYHKHSGSNGCYKTEYYHKHTNSCPKKSIWVDWVDPPYWGTSYKCGDQPDNTSRDVLICSKSSGTVDTYSIGCGLSDGQIVAAHIVYNRSITSQTAFYTKETEMAEEIIDNDQYIDDTSQPDSEPDIVETESETTETDSINPEPETESEETVSDEIDTIIPDMTEVTSTDEVTATEEMISEPEETFSESLGITADYK